MHTPSNAVLLRLLLAAVLVSGCGPVAEQLPPEEEATVEQQVYAADAYARLRQLEDLFPIPQSTQTVSVGTYDASTGQFSGLVSTTEYRIDPITRKPRAYTIRPRAELDAVRAILSFSVTNRGAQSFRVWANDQYVSAPAGAASVTLDVGRAKSVSWRVQVGTQTYSDTLLIARPGVLGAGAFTVAALPVSIVYEPPQTGAGLSRTVLTNTLSVGSSVTEGDAQESSSSRAKFNTVGAMQQKLGALKSLIGVYGLGVNKPYSTMIDSLVTALGSVTTTSLQGTTVNSQSTLETVFTESLTTSTSAGLGPGRGDRLGYLKNAQVAWVMLDGDLTLTLIGWESRATGYTAKNLRDDLTRLSLGQATVTGLDQVTLENLLTLDPFVVSANPCSMSSRFEYLGRYEGDGADSYVVSRTVKATDQQSRSDFTSTVKQSNPGWVSALFDGATPSTQLFKTTHSTLRSLTTTTTVTATLEMKADLAHPYKVDLYYDKVFGTFAAKSPPSSLCSVVLLAQ